MEILRSLGSFLIGIIKRIYWLLPSILLDPFDIAERFGVNFTVPSHLVWILAAIGFFIACFLTYHDLRSKKVVTIKINKDVEKRAIIKQRKSSHLADLPGLLNDMRKCTVQLVEARVINKNVLAKIKGTRESPDFGEILIYSQNEAKKHVITFKEKSMDINEQKAFLLEITNAMEASGYGLSKLRKSDALWTSLADNFDKYKPDFMIDSELSNHITNFNIVNDGIGNYILQSKYQKLESDDITEKELGKDFITLSKRKSYGGRRGLEVLLNKEYEKTVKRVNYLLNGGEIK